MSWLPISYTLQIVLVGTALLGGVSGVVGSFAVLRRRALLGDVLAHSALPGICLAFLALQWMAARGWGVEAGLSFWPMLLGALGTGLLAASTMTLITSTTRTKADAAIGIVLSTFFGIGVVLSSRIQRLQGGASPAGLEGYLYGNAAALNRGDVLGIAAVSAVVLIVVMALYKEFQLTSFDAEFASAQGWPTKRLDLLLMGLVAVTTVAGLPAVGVVLMAALLITPAAAARFWCDRLTPMLALAGAFGALSGVLGTLLSHAGFGPPGPLVVLVAAAFFVASILVAPSRGVVAQAVRQWRLRQAFQEHHLLRALYELGESQPEPRPWLTPPEVAAARDWTPAQVQRAASRAVQRGVVERSGAQLRLSPSGLEEARDITRSHRMWELFWLQRDSSDWRDADRAADAIEHLLSPQAVEELAEQLGVARELGAGPSSVPPSPHELPGRAPETPS